MLACLCLCMYALSCKLAKWLHFDAESSLHGSSQVAATYAYVKQFFNARPALQHEMGQ